MEFMLSSQTHSSSLSKRLIYTALIYFVVGVSLGMYMGITHDFSLRHVHVHINLLGWVALGIVGAFYAAYPALQRGWMAHAHYWLHTAGVAIFMGGFAWGVIGGEFVFAPVAIGSTMTALAVLLLSVHVFRVLPKANAATAPDQPGSKSSSSPAQPNRCAVAVNPLPNVAATAGE
jgi:hypothetical protein